MSTFLVDFHVTEFYVVKDLRKQRFVFNARVKPLTGYDTKNVVFFNKEVFVRRSQAIQKKSFCKVVGPVAFSLKEKTRIPLDLSKTKHKRAFRIRQVRQLCCLLCKQTERGKRLRFVTVKMLNRNNFRLMWYDQKLLKTKSSFFNNVHPSLSAGVNSCRELNPAFLHYNQRLSYLYPTNLDKMSFLSSDLANLTLSLKTYTFLKEKGIHKIGDLVGYSQKSLLQLLNKNKEMFAEVKTYLLTNK